MKSSRTLLSAVKVFISFLFNAVETYSNYFISYSFFIAVLIKSSEKPVEFRKIKLFRFFQIQGEISYAHFLTKQIQILNGRY